MNSSQALKSNPTPPRHVQHHSNLCPSTSSSSSSSSTPSHSPHASILKNPLDAQLSSVRFCRGSGEDRGRDNDSERGLISCRGAPFDDSIHCCHAPSDVASSSSAVNNVASMTSSRPDRKLRDLVFAKVFRCVAVVAVTTLVVTVIITALWVVVTRGGKYPGCKEKCSDHSWHV